MRDQNREQFERLFRDHYPKVLRFFRAKGYSPSDAEDLAQDTFHRVCKSVQSYRGGEASYVLAVAGNLWKNELRGRSTMKRDAVVESMDACPPDRLPLTETRSEPLLGPPPATPEQTTLAEEGLQTLSQAIRGLPSRQRQALEMRAEGWSYREIAEEMESTEDAVRKLLSASRKRLRTDPAVQAAREGVGS